MEDSRSEPERMEDLFGYMIGPKAENMDIFRKLVLEALDDHMFWRRNFYPEDTPVVSAFGQSKKGYREFIDRLRDYMFEFLSDAKKGIPFFSPRYIGHMNTDLLLPALVGYFGAMLYNQNNVAGESSPVTVKLESEVIRMLLKMVGMDPGQGFGYLCSGGTAANLYSLWVARNLRTLPIAMRLALVPDAPLPPPEPTVNILRSLKVKVESAKEALDLLKEARQALAESLTLSTAKGEKKAILSMSAWELANVTTDELCRLRTRSCELIAEKISLAPVAAGVLTDELVNRFTIKTLGDYGFRSAAAALFPKDLQLFTNAWHVYVAKNSHYSWKKSSDVVGLGQHSLVEVPHLPGFDVDLDALEKALLADVQGGAGQRHWPLMVVSDFGTTEEGALDNLPGVHRLLEKLQQEHGATVWWHVDAAYGGYLASMIRQESDDEGVVEAGDIDTKETLKNWLAQCGQAVGLDADEVRDFIEISETGSGSWLPWQEFIDRTAAMSKADSITIDPHKLGYVPYPAGVVLLRDRVAREVVSSYAPYLWAQDTDPDAFVGRFTLEGSRPGATAAACWLAHSTIPLDQSGHGKLLALSILATRQLYRALQRRLAGPDNPARVALLHQPHTNMICYVPYHVGSDTLERVRDLTNRVLEELKPTNFIRPFMAVATEVDLSTSHPVLEGLDTQSPFLKLINTDEERVKIRVIRSVVMGPYALNAKTQPVRRTQVCIFDAYADSLAEIIKRTAERQDIELILKKAEQWSRDMKFMVMDDDPTVTDQLRALLAELRHPRIMNPWRHCETEQEALDCIREKVPLDMVFLDIDMSGSTEVPKGKVDSGYTAYEAILRRNRDVTDPRYQVKSVVFFSKGYADHKNHIAQLHQAYPTIRPKIQELDKLAVERRAMQEERIVAVRALIREIADIDIE